MFKRGEFHNHFGIFCSKINVSGKYIEADVLSDIL